VVLPADRQQQIADNTLDFGQAIVADRLVRGS